MKTNHLSRLFDRLYALLFLLIPFRRQKEEDDLSPIGILPATWRNAYSALYEPNKDLKGRPSTILSAKMTDLKLATISLLEAVPQQSKSGSTAFFRDLPDPPNAGSEIKFGDNRELAAKQMYMMLSGWWAVQRAMNQTEEVQENVSELAEWYAIEYKRRTDEFDIPIKRLFREMEISENEMRGFVANCIQEHKEIFALKRKIDFIVIRVKRVCQRPFLSETPYLSNIIDFVARKWVDLRTQKLQAKTRELQGRLFSRERREEAVKYLTNLRNKTEKERTARLHEAIRARSRELFPLPIQPVARTVFPQIFLNSEDTLRKK